MIRFPSLWGEGRCEKFDSMVNPIIPTPHPVQRKLQPEARIRNGIWIFWTSVFNPVRHKQRFFHTFRVVRGG